MMLGLGQRWRGLLLVSLVGLSSTVASAQNTRGAEAGYHAALEALRVQVAALSPTNELPIERSPVVADAVSRDGTIAPREPLTVTLPAASPVPGSVGSGPSDRVAEQFRQDMEELAARVIETETGPVSADVQESAGIATRDPIILTAAFTGGTFRDDSETLEGVRFGPELGLSTTIGDWFLSAVGSYNRLDGEFDFPPGTEVTDSFGARASVGYNFAPLLGWADNWFLQGFMTVGGEYLAVDTVRGIETDPTFRNESSGPEWQVFASPLLSISTRQEAWFLSAGLSTVHSLYTEEERVDSFGTVTPRETNVGTIIQVPLDAERDFPVSLFGEDAIFTPGFGITPAYAITGVDPGEDPFSLTLRPRVRLTFENFSLFADGAIQTLNRDDSVVGRVGIDIPL